jgi:hypothetical protein
MERSDLERRSKPERLEIAGCVSLVVWEGGEGQAGKGNFVVKLCCVRAREEAQGLREAWAMGADRQTDRRTDRQTDRQTDGQAGLNLEVVSRGAAE